MSHPQTQITEVPVPSASALHATLHNADFYDCYLLPADPGERTAMALYLAVVGQTPTWVNFLMRVRNAIVGLFGLKNLGSLSGLSTEKAASAYRVGERVGIFTLFAIGEDELILGDDDKHLTVKLSVLKISVDGRPCVAVSTVVHVKNTLGRVYMFFVGPAHKIIAPAVLRRGALGLV